MRLIDAEALLQDVQEQIALTKTLFPDEEINLISKMLEDTFKRQIDRMPTIEAIPIDFIKQTITDKRYILARASEKTAPYYEHAVRALEMLLWEWEKENGRSK